MAKNLNVSLFFTADSSKVRAELNSLKKSLNELSSSTALKTPNFEFTKDLQEASRAATQLKVQLDAAVNTKTGNLDLTKFSESMKKSGMSLEKYQNQLYQLGPAGEKAFADLTKAITMADVPLRRSSKLLDELWTTMKNTARWQLTSSAMHGFMGAVSSAYGYAKDLNASLNDIRIVTGATTEKMAEFAKEANNAAKALSTTTTDYTKASLVFYQQGLDDAQVKERTDITIKMANAAGASAEKVSDQLTAVWNNFYDGTKSLEYYADVMTALGAATASSTDEIAGGLEKFAAIGKTIGLSYEYAASALATITSNTRQSEEVVGTALKTIFARIQGLNLGETLDDGVTLNKYSQALEKVGISIFDSAGELKNMDNILDEMAAKWDTLSNSQQVALAQTVAGVRQYNQLIALMDNWNSGDSDSMVANLTTATNSTGTLQNQADIYAESWEAANKRVKASAEAVYSAILNDEFFIDLSNGFADLIDGVKIFIDSLGGVKGVLLAIGSIVTNVFSKQIGQGINNAIFSLKGFFNPQAILDAEVEQKKEVNKLLIEGFKDKGTTSGGQSAEVYAQIGAQQISYIQNAERMSEVEKVVNQQLMDRNQLLADEAIKAGQILEKTEEKIAEERQSLAIQAKIAAAKNPDKSHGGVKAAEGISDLQKKVESLTKSYSVLNVVGGKLEITKNLPQNSQEFAILKTNIDSVVKSLVGLNPEDTISDFSALGKVLNVSAKDAKAFYDTLQNADSVTSLQTVIAEMAEAAGTGSATAISNLRTALINCTGDTKKADEMMENYLATVRQFGPDSVEAQEALNKLKTGVSSLSDEMDKTKEKPMELSQAFSKAASAVMAMGQAFTTITGIIDMFNDSEATTGEKIMALISGIGMLIPAIMAIAPAFSTASVGATLFGSTATAAGTAASLAMWQVTLIVAAITAIIAVVALLVTRESEAERQARKTAETAESMKKAADEAKQSFENLKSAFDAYDTAVEKLNECREGTEEWNEALKEVNNTVLDILQNSPELAKNANLFTRDENGMLTINQDEKENVLRQAERNANVAAAGAVMAQAQASEANTQLEKSNLSSEVGSTGIGNVIYTDYGPVYDQMLNAGKILTDNASDLAGLTETEYRAKVKELLDNAASDQAKSSSNYTTQIDNLVDECVTYQSQINSLAQNTEEAANQMHNAALLLAEQELGNDYGAAEKTVAANQYDDIYDRIYKEIINEDKKNAQIDESTSISKNIWKRYNKAMGTNLVASKNQIQGDDNNRVYAYKGESGEETVTIEHMAATIAAFEALKEMGNSAEEAATKLSEIEDKIGTENADVLKGFIAGQGFEGASQEDFNNFYRNVATYNPEGTATGSASKTDVAWYVDKMFGDGADGMISDETAKKYGYETGQAMIDAMYEQISNANEVWESIEIGGFIGFENLSMDAAIAFDNAYKQMNLGPLGEKAGETFVNGINDILNIKKLDPDKQVEALEKLSEIDWSANDSLEKVQAVMATFNVDLDIAQWKEFADTMRIAYGTIPDYTKIKTELTEIGAIIADIEFGSIIKEEDFEVLAKYSAAWRDLFILQADGTRKFIGNAEDMKKAMQTSIRENGEDLLKKEQYATAIKDAGIKTSYSEEEIEIAAGGDGKDGLFRFYDNDKATITLKNLGYNVSNGVVKKGNEEISQADASKIVMANQRGQFAKDLINEQEIQDALQMQGYSRDRQNEIISAALAGNDEELKVMMEGLNTLVGQDYEQLNKDFQQMLASTATSFGELNQMLVDNEIEMDAYEQGVKKLLQEQMNAATTMGELEQAWSAALATGIELDYNIYIDGLLQLSEQYSICAEEAKAFSIALQSNNEEARKATEENLEATILLGEAADTYGFKAEELSIQSKQLAKEYGLNAKAAAKLTIENQRMNKGVETLVNNWDNWSSELKSNNKLSRDWSKAAAECTKVIADLVGASEDLELPADFFDSAKNMDLLSQAAEGSTKAINELGLIVANAQIQMLSFQEGMQNAEHEFIDQTQFDTWKTTIMSGITDLQNALNNVGMGTDVYEKLGGDKWIAALNEMAIATQMSVDQMNSILNSMGVQAEVEIKSVEQKMQVPTYTEYVEQDETGIDTNGDGEEDAFGYRRFTVPGKPQEVEGYVQVAQIKTADSEIGPPKIKYAGNGNVSNSAKSGGSSGSKAKKVDKTKKSDVVDRYKEITDSIDDVQNAMNDASRAADRLYGPTRLKQMKEQNKLIKDEVKLLQQKRVEAKQYLKEDEIALQKAAQKAGVSLKFDKNGNISNYTEQLNKLYEELAHHENIADSYAGGSEERQSNYIEKNIEPLQKKIEELKAAIAQYDDTRELLEDLDDEIEEKWNEWQDNNYEQLTYKLELKIEINDRDLEALEYYLSKVEDDFYRRAEGMTYLLQQSKVYGDSLQNNQTHFDNLTTAYNSFNEDGTRYISQDKYIEGLKEIYANAKDTATSLYELDETMMTYYRDTLDMANEQLSKYNDRVEHHVLVLDHFKNIMDIIGESTNYEALGVILEGQAEIIANELKVAEDTYDFYAAEAKAKKKLFDEALAQGNTEAAEFYEAEWEAAEEKAREAQDNMLAKTEEWAEAMKAVLENQLSGLSQTLENALTGGTSFDTITTQMERAVSLQEEYLTTTNKIYETNKIINNAQKEIDKTTNNVAKQKLRCFQEETVQLQNNSKLSQYELDIQQAKYDLLLAEIALEEAQQAKSTVRLQRDSEGNFGYVYTANANAVADAEQKLADAQNNLYNIGLEGANDYASKYQETVQEMYDTLTDLQTKYLNGEFETEEEYHQAVEDAKAYYYQQLENYSHLYSTALTVDSRVVADAWSTDFQGMIENTDQWKIAVEEYVGNVGKAFKGWEDIVHEIREKTVGKDLNALKTNVTDIVDANDALALSITEDGGVIDTMSAQMKAVNNLTNAHALYRAELLADIEAAELLMQTTDQLLDKIATEEEAQTSSQNKINSESINNNTNKINNSTNDVDTTTTTASLVKGMNVTVKESATHYATGSDGKRMANFVPGGSYTVLRLNGEEVLIGRGNSATGWVYKKDLVGFDTGGYTGQWGQDGKLAMLHEKELILNPDDTTNFLASLKILHDIIDVINLHSINAQMGKVLNTPTYSGLNKIQTLEQQVHIEASFPGVSDRNELEEAFNNLINHASQFANRKNF